jgi:hypothetical protein
LLIMSVKSVNVPERVSSNLWFTSEVKAIISCFEWLILKTS